MISGIIQANTIVNSQINKNMKKIVILFSLAVCGLVTACTKSSTTGPVAVVPENVSATFVGTSNGFSDQIILMRSSKMLLYQGQNFAVSFSDSMVRVPDGIDTVITQPIYISNNSANISATIVTRFNQTTIQMPSASPFASSYYTEQKSY